MSIRPIRLLGDPVLWQRSAPVDAGRDLSTLFADLRDSLLDFRRRYGIARAISAPQIGELLRVVYVYEPGPPRHLLNPVLTLEGSNAIEVWENCISFPGLYVRTRRNAACSVSYRRPDGREAREEAEGELAYTLQHECDHLDGVLTLQRAVDAHSFYLGGPGRRPPGLPSRRPG